MNFKGINNQFVELGIVNYQFPDSRDKDWDGNWLNIFLKVKSDFGDWQTIDPALTTWEVQEIIDWLTDLSNNTKPQWTELEFAEPNLSFVLENEFTDDLKEIRICFDLEFRPKSADDEKDYFVDIKTTNDQLRKYAKDLEVELKKYPERIIKSQHTTKTISKRGDSEKRNNNIFNQLWARLTGKCL